jgi:predicted amidohydrolase YtcJ
MATLAITNGQIWDGENPPFLGTVLCSDLITSVIPGPLPTLPPNIEILDARGGTVIPAFTDSHVHFSCVARLAKAVDLSVAKSQSDAVRLLLERSAIVPPNAWIMGVKMNNNLWPNPAYPTLAELDQVPNPVLIQHWCCHSHLVNSRAIAVIGEDAFHGIPGVVRDVDGRMTGLLEAEKAQRPVQHFLEHQEDDPEEWVPVIQRVLSEGIAEVHAIGAETIFMHESLRVYQRLRAAGKLGVRFRFFFTQYPEFPLSAQSPFGDDWICYQGFKLFIDGVLSGRTAALRERYVDVDRTGVLFYTDDELYELIKRGYRGGLQVMAHMIGDRASDQFLRALERLKEEGFESEWPVKLSHIELCDAEQIERITRLNAYGDIQAGFITTVAPFMPSVIGPERMQRFMPIKSLTDAGVTSVGSSDAPIGPTNPLYAIHGAVCRNDLMGRAECIGLDQALRMYTINAQKLIKNDHRKGLLKPGYIADITVLEDDLFAVPPETLAGRKVAATIVDGKVAFRRNP